jgi:hypothetical protein
VSYSALEWAFRQDLEAISKFALVVLADAANREGVCWPRIATIAKKMGVSTRTVQRSLRLQARRGLITIEERYRPDGSRSSNRYRLHLDRGVSVSPPTDYRDTSLCHGSQGPHDTSVMSRTTRGTDNEPPPLLQGVVEKQPVVRGGDDFDLVYPGALLSQERAGAEAMLAELQPPLDQLVLDEWSGIIAAGAIRASPLGCLRELVKRARKGTFTPERGLRVARARDRQQRMEIAQADIDRPELPVADENNPLVKRLRSLAKSQSG